MGKLYSIVRASSKEVLEEFGTLNAAEQFLIIMKGRGEDVILITDKDATVEENPGFDISGLELKDPDVEFGNELDQFDDDTPGLLDQPEVDNDDL